MRSRAVITVAITVAMAPALAVLLAAPPAVSGVSGAGGTSGTSGVGGASAAGAVRVVPLDVGVPAQSAGEVRRWRRRVAHSLSRAWAEATAPGAPPEQPPGFGPHDVAVYRVWAPGEPERIVGLPRQAHIEADGSVAFPERGAQPRPAAPPGAAATGPAQPHDPFGGPWGRERIDTWVVYDTDDGGLWCNTTAGEVRMHAVRRRLADRSRRHDYVGVVVRAVAEITDAADNCDDMIEWFSVGFWSPSRGAIWLDQDPVSGSTGSCRDLQAGVSAGAAAVATGFATVSRTFRRCEQWTVGSGLPVPPAASAHYDVRYERGGVTDNDQREAGMVAVVRLRAGARLDPHYGLGLGVGNQR